MNTEIKRATPPIPKSDMLIMLKNQQKRSGPTYSREAPSQGTSDGY